MQGFYKISNEPGETVKGSSKALFNFTRISLYPHNKYEKEKVFNTSNRHCPDTLRVVRSSRSREMFEVSIRAFRKRACRNAFGILESEFSFLKLETRRKRSSKYDKLYFAEIPTIRVTRKYKPKSYQLPLQRYNANNCTICMKIRSGTGVRPPKLPQTPPRAVRLDGQWASTTCEATPGGLFLTRHFKFIKFSLSWEAHYYFYLDNDCKDLDFELIGKGQFVGGIPSKVVAGAFEYVFTMTEALMTPIDSITTRLWNTFEPNSCGKSTWKTHVTQDITSTGGCRMYGISLPHTEYDLLKTETDPKGNRLLYVGQRASDGTDPSSPSRRATSFQVPLVECSSFKFKFVPPTTRPTTRPTTIFRKQGPVIPLVTIPTLRQRDSTTRRRTDRETTGKTTSRKNEQMNVKTRKVSADAKFAFGNSAKNWSSGKLLLVFSMVLFAAF